MNNYLLDQKNPLGSDKVATAPANLQRKSRSAIPNGSILDKLVDFACSIPFRISAVLAEEITATNLDTLQRIVISLFSIWRGRRKKLADKTKGLAELMRSVSLSFSKLMKFLRQK